MEFLHQIPGGWTVTDELSRAAAWRSLGIDDVLELTVPWSTEERVSYQDTASGNVMERRYGTPEGDIVHRVRKTRETLAPGWVTQPNAAVLIEDFNIPRAD